MGDAVSTEQFIVDAAARGWSKTQTRQALGLGTWKVWAILDAMPPIDWTPKGHTLGNKLGNASRRNTPAVHAAIAKAREARREGCLHTWQGRSGTVEELAAYSPASARTIRRRLSEGMAVDQAFSLPPSTQTPDAGWRTGSRGAA